MFNAEFPDPENLTNNDITIVVYLMKEEKIKTNIFNTIMNKQNINAFGWKHLLLLLFPLPGACGGFYDPWHWEYGI